MEKAFVATPTDYKGVRFRSKSEAMFALWLDQLINVRWIYEPFGTVVGDFLLVGVGKTDSRVHTFAELIEYKPNKPTSAYIKRFTDKVVERFDEIIASAPKHDDFYASIYWGSVYTEETGVICVGRDGEMIERSNWIEDYRDAIKAYRFDLEHPA